MKIAVCDDNTMFLQEVVGALKQYSETYHTHVEYKMFPNPLELVAQIENGAHYDVILMDVMMPGINGIQCARDIRDYDNCVKIVFMTCSPEFAVDSYSVGAAQYLLKPIKKEKLFMTLRQLEVELEHAKKFVFLLKTKSGITKIALSALEYCEVINRKLVLRLANGEEYECGLKMSDLEEKLLSFGMFIRPHRSYIINMDYIRSMTTSSIVMECGIEVPIPRDKSAQIKQTYMNYMFRSPETIFLENDEK